MKVSCTSGSGVLATAGLLLLSACSSQPSAPVSAAAKRAESGPARTPAPSPTPDLRTRWPDQKPEEFEAAWKLVDKAVAAMGGAAAVDGARSLVTTGKMEQQTQLGVLSATVTTTLLFPGSIRRDVTLPTGDVVSSVATPDGAWMTGTLGTFPLEPADQDRLRAGAARNPVLLLQSRHDPLFRAWPGGPPAPGTPGDVLFVRVGSEESQLFLDAEGRIAQIAFVTTNPFDASVKGRLEARFSDFRTVDGLVYPFSSEAFSGGQSVSSLKLETVHVNTTVAPDLFRMPDRPAPPTPTPTPR